MGAHLGTIEVETAGGINRIAAEDWDRIANPDPRAYNPTLRHAFFRALEESGSIVPDAGWLPRHLVARDSTGNVRALMPLYLKGHSYGEYVFDQGWADAYERHGLDYYPKLLAAVPVTPVPGRRVLMADPQADQTYGDALAAAVVEVARQEKLSSVHATFLEPAEAERLEQAGWLIRLGQQYHWQNAGYAGFDDFLATLASRKRKGLKRERREALAEGITIEWLRGGDITEAHWDVFFAFYMDTGSRKWGSPYLNRTFFSLLGSLMGEDVLLVLCKRAGRYIAGALNLIGGEALYGRYWGCLEQHPFLHFEACYYQAIDFAIANKLTRVEAGAGGEHKLVRGYLPAPTYSAHWIADRRFRSAIKDFVDRERRAVEHETTLLSDLGPYRKES